MTQRTTRDEEHAAVMSPNWKVLCWAEPLAYASDVMHLELHGEHPRAFRRSCRATCRLAVTLCLRAGSYSHPMEYDFLSSKLPSVEHLTSPSSSNNTVLIFSPLSLSYFVIILPSERPISRLQTPMFKLPNTIITTQRSIDICGHNAPIRSKLYLVSACENSVRR
jgi:hypothetical protein